MTQRRSRWCLLVARFAEPSPTGRDAAGRLSREVTGEVIPRRLLTQPESERSSSTFRDFTGCRGPPCRRKRETHRGFHIKLDDTVALETFQLISADSNRREHFGGVFAEFGRASRWPVSVGGVGHFYWSAGDADLTAIGIVAVDQHPALRGFRICDHFVDGAHWRAW